MSDKYFYGLAAACAAAWLEALTGREIGNNLQEALKSGVILCEAINKIKPNTIPNINRMSSPFKERENIESYIKACKELGMKEVDLFVTVDLYEGQNMTQVVDQICSLGGVAQKLNSKLPVFGIKYSDENPRSFSDDVLRQAKQVPSRQTQGSYGYQDESKNPIIARQIIKNVSGIQASEEPTMISKGGIDMSGHSTSGIDKIIKNPELFQAQKGGGSSSGSSKFCNSCGTERQPNAKFCGNCGNSFN